MQDSKEGLSVNEMLRSVREAVFAEQQPVSSYRDAGDAEVLQDAYLLTKDMLIQNIQPMIFNEKEFAVTSARILKKFARVFALHGHYKQKRVMAKDGS